MVQPAKWTIQFILFYFFQYQNDIILMSIKSHFDELPIVVSSDTTSRMLLSQRQPPLDGILGTPNPHQSSGSPSRPAPTNNLLYEI